MAFSAVTERGSGVIKTAGTTVTMSPSANLTVGKIVFAWMVADNTATTTGATTTHSAMADNAGGNTWNKVSERTMTNGAAADGTTSSLWWCKVATQIGTGNVITGTMASCTAKVLMVWEVSVGSGNSIQAAGTPQFFEGTAANPAALVMSGMASKEYLFLGLLGAEDEQITWTEEATFTNVFASEGVSTGPAGVPASNQTGFAAYRIATDTGATFDIAYATSEMALRLVAFEEVSAGVTGTIAATQDAQTGALSGTVINPITGTIAATQAAQTGAFVGIETFAGTIAATQDPNVAALAGTVANPVTGTIAAVQEDDTGALSGTVTPPAVTGTIAATQDDQTGALTGAESFLGTIGATQGDDTAALTGTVANPITGTIAATQEDDTAAFDGTVVSDGTLNAIQDDQTGAFTGTVANPVTGILDSTQDDQTGALSGTVSAPAVTGTIGAVQDDQTGSFTGIAAFGVAGVLGAVQDDQTGSFTGTVIPPAVTGVIAAQQDDQVGAFVGISASGVVGTIGAVQDPNVGSFTGTVANPTVGPPGTVTCVIGGPTVVCEIGGPTVRCVVGGPTVACTITQVSVAGTDTVLTATFKNAAGVLTDPAAVTAVVQHPDGTQTIPVPTSASVGVWTTVIPSDPGEDGWWFGQITGTGNDVNAVCVFSFCLEPSLVLV